jgi:hypothetical protein
MSIESTMRAMEAKPVRLNAVRMPRMLAVLTLSIFLVSVAEAAVTLIGLTIDDPATQNVVESYTLARDLPSVRFLGTRGQVDWLLDRPAFTATVARHLYPPLERYHVIPRKDGTYEVNDLGSLRGSFRLVAHEGNRRVYFCQGEFRSLAHILKLSGGLVFTLELRDLQQGSDAYMEVTPQLYVRLDNIVAHGLLKVLSPLINGVIDRRVGNLTAATQIVGERLARDPAGLYREMRSWPDLRPEELEAYRLTFLTDEGNR